MEAAWAIYGIGFLIFFGVAGYMILTHQEDTPHEPLNVEHIVTELTVRSPAFPHEETIPSKYTCDGENLSPPLAIDDIPEGTASLVLIMEDPDSPNGTWDHWVMFNMPANTDRVGEGDAPKGTSGKNTWGAAEYGGPCPHDGEHRYVFNVYALDTSLRLFEGTPKEEVLEAMKGHILAKGELMGRYERQQMQVLPEQE